MSSYGRYTSASSSTAVRDLSTEQLEAALKSRGVRMPSSVQSHSWYLSRAEEIRLTSVPNSELQRGGPPSAMSPSSRGSSQYNSPARGSTYATSARGGRDDGPARLEVQVVDMQLSQEIMRGSTRPRNVSVRVETPQGVDEGTSPSQLESRTVQVPSGSSPVMRINSKHEIVLERSSRGWSALQRALDGPKEGSDLYFVALDASSGKALGEAYLRLQTLMSERNPPSETTLDLLDVQHHTRSCGNITVRTDGLLDALNLVGGRSSSSSQSSARGGAYDRGRAGSRGGKQGGDAEIELGVQQVKLDQRFTRFPNVPSSISVRVEARCIYTDRDPILETPPVKPPSPASLPLRFDWTHFIPLDQGSAEWERLGLSLTGAAAASDLHFVVRDYAKNRDLGQVSVNLKQLLDDGKEKIAQSVRVTDASGLSVADIMLTVKALDALREVERTESRGGKGSSRYGSRESSRDPARRSGRDPAPPADYAEVDISVSEFKLQMTRDKPRSVAVRIEALGMEDGEQLETRAIPPTGTQPVRFNWNHTLQLNKGQPAWDALGRAIDESQANSSPINLFFIAIDGSNGTEVGEASYDLAPLLKPYAQESSREQQIQVKNRQGGIVGQLSVRVKALDALKLLREDANPPPQSDAPKGPPKKIRELTANELHAVLAGRGIRLPSTTQAKNYYIEQCNKNRITSVELDELHAVTQKQKDVVEEASVDIGVDSMQLTDRALKYDKPRSVAVRIEALGMEDGQRLETRSLPPGSGNQPVRFNWNHTLNLVKGQPPWDALARAVDDGNSGREMNLVFLAVDGDRGTVLGEANCNLTPLLRESREKPSQQLQLFDSRQIAIGHVTVSVKALDAMLLVQKGRRGSSKDGSAPKVISVKVPSLHMPGEPVQVTHEGQTFDVDVPRGMRPGQSFDVEIPGRPAETSRPGTARSSTSRDSARDSYDSRRQQDPVSPNRRGRWGEDEKSSSRQPAVSRQDSTSSTTAADRRKAYDAQQKAQRAPSVDSRDSGGRREEQQRSPGRSSYREAPTYDDQSGGGREGGGRRWASSTVSDDMSSTGRRWAAQQEPPQQQPGVQGLASTLPTGVASTFSGGTNPTEVEHALIVAFERLGQANSQIASHQTQRGKLEKELAKVREENVSMTKELRQLKAEREVQGQRLAELGATMGMGAAGGGIAAIRRSADGTASTEKQLQIGYTESLKKRLGAFQASKQEEMRKLNKSLQEARDATAKEATERSKAEKQTVDTLRRLSEAQAALDMERRHSAAVGTERERLQTALNEANTQLQEMHIVLEAEQQLRYALEKEHGIEPLPGVTRPAAPRQPGFGVGAASRPATAGARSSLASTVPVRGATAGRTSRPSSRPGSKPASRAASPGRDKRDGRSTSRERGSERDGRSTSREPAKEPDPPPKGRRWQDPDRASAPSASATTERESSRDAHRDSRGGHSVPLKVSNAFARYDRDNSGFLDARELRPCLKHYGVDVEREESRRYLAAYDDTPDGRLDLQEFAALVKDLESPLFQATHGGGASSRDDYRDDRSSHETAGSDKMASVPEHGQSRASQFLAQSGTASARSTRGSFSDRNNPPPSVRPQSSYTRDPPPPSPCGDTRNTLSSSTRSAAGGEPRSPLASNYAAYKTASGQVAASAGPATDKDTQMAIRMRNMSSDLGSALERGAQQPGQRPLATQYQDAVARRDATEHAALYPGAEGGGEQPLRSSYSAHKENAGPSASSYAAHKATTSTAQPVGRVATTSTAQPVGRVATTSTAQPAGRVVTASASTAQPAGRVVSATTATASAGGGGDLASRYAASRATTSTAQPAGRVVTATTSSSSGGGDLASRYAASRATTSTAQPAGRVVTAATTSSSGGGDLASRYAAARSTTTATVSRG